MSEDMLRQLYEMQLRLVNDVGNRERGKTDMDDADIDKQISGLCVATIHECVELQRLTNWKWWKAPTEFNEKEAREELIDIWHFVIQMSIVMGMRPEDIVMEYQKKHEINRERQRSGY